jgi:ribosomal protein S3
MGNAPRHLVKKNKNGDRSLYNQEKIGFDSFYSFFRNHPTSFGALRSKSSINHSKAKLIFDTSGSNNPSFLLNFNKKVLENHKNLQINIKHHYSRAQSASLLVQNISRFILAYIKKRRGGKNKLNQLKNVTYRILQTISKSKMKDSLSAPRDGGGIGFAFSGRVYGAKKANNLKLFLGSVPFSTLDAEIDYSNMMQKTKNGT